MSIWQCSDWKTCRLVITSASLHRCNSHTRINLLVPKRGSTLSTCQEALASIVCPPMA